MSIRFAGNDIKMGDVGKALLVGGGVGATATALAHLINLPREEQEVVLEIAAENEETAEDVIRNALLIGGGGSALYLAGLLDNDNESPNYESDVLPDSAAEVRRENLKKTGNRLSSGTERRGKVRRRSSAFGRN